MRSGRRARLGDAAADDFQRHELQRLRVGTIAVDLLVQLAIARLDRRQHVAGHGVRRQPDAQGGGLADVLHIGADGDLVPSRIAVTFEREQAQRLLDVSCDRGIDIGRLNAVEAPEKGADELMLDVGEQHAERAEEPGDRRHDDAADPEALREAGRVHAAVAADREQAELRRVAAALRSDRLQRAHHARVGDQVDAVGGIGQGQVELRSERAHRVTCLVVGQREIAADQRRGIQVTQQQVGVGHRRLGAAAVVADRPRLGAGAARADLHAAGGVDRRDAAAARADFGDIDGRHLHDEAGAFDQARAERGRPPTSVSGASPSCPFCTMQALAVVPPMSKTMRSPRPRCAPRR